MTSKGNTTNIAREFLAQAPRPDIRPHVKRRWRGRLARGCECGHLAIAHGHNRGRCNVPGCECAGFVWSG